MKCHIIPQLLIREYSKSKKIYSIDLFKKEIKYDYISNTAYIENFYLNEKNNDLEKELSKYESKIAPIFKKINDAENKVTLNRIENELLKKYMIIQALRNKEASNVNGKILDLQDLKNIEKTFIIHPVYSKYYTSILDIQNLPFMASNSFGWNLNFDYDFNKIPGNFFYPIGKKLIVYSPIPWNQEYLNQLFLNSNTNQEKTLEEFGEKISMYNSSINSMSIDLILKAPIYMMKSCGYKRFFQEGEDNKCELVKSNDDLYEWEILMFNQDLLDVILLSCIQNNLNFILFNSKEEFENYIEKMYIQLKKYENIENINFTKVKSIDDAIKYFLYKLSVEERFWKLIDIMNLLNK